MHVTGRAGAFGRPDTHTLLMFGLALVLVSLSEPAFAQAGGGNINTFLQNAVNLITGTAGRLIAIIAIAISGILAAFGATSWRFFGQVILGVMILFSAAWIVDQMIGA